MINEMELAEQLRGSGVSQVSAEEFAAQVKGMTEQQAMETAAQDSLTVFHDIALAHGFTPDNARTLLAEAGQEFELDDEWTPEGAIYLSEWLREAQAKKRRTSPELPYEPDVEGAARIPDPAYDDARVVTEVIDAEVVDTPIASATTVVGDMDLSINFDTREQAEEFLATLKATGVSLGKPGVARVVMKISSYTAQAAVWQDL
tara:strand:- start:1522 stop:2130 length:609 start_codon:yes stop_codon:yes gene_type:complete